MEIEFREELRGSYDFYFSENSTSRLKDVIESAGHSTKTAYVLHWTPDQGEDIYTVLIDGSYLVITEIDRKNESLSSTVEREEIKEYLLGLSRMNQVRLIVAQELANPKT